MTPSNDMCLRWFVLLFVVCLFVFSVLLGEGVNSYIETNSVLYRQSFHVIDWFVFNATFSNIMATSFSDGRSRSTRREPPIMSKQLVNFITCGIGDTARRLIHFKISMRLLIFIEVRPIIYQNLQNFANINNLMLK
jgi:hypothetical protein